MKLERDTLVFFDFETFDKENRQIILSLNDVTSYDLRNVAFGTYKRCTCRWRDTKTKTTYVGTYSVGLSGGGEALIYEKVSSNEEAKERAKKWLINRNKIKLELTIKVVGDVRLQAGIKVDIKDAGRFDGLYYVFSATHSVSRGSGYVTDCVLRL